MQMKKGLGQGFQAMEAQQMIFWQNIVTTTGTYMRKRQMQEGFFYVLKNLQLPEFLNAFWNLGIYKNVSKPF